MDHRTHTWLLLADSRRGRLMRCEFVYGGRWHIDEIESIQNPYEAGHERGRPDALAAGRAGGVQFSFAAPGQTSDEELRRFARDVVAWLEKRIDGMGLGTVHLFAPARFLGLLRREYTSLVRACVSDCEADLAWLPAGELATHPAIEPLLGAGASG